MAAIQSGTGGHSSCRSTHGCSSSRSSRWLRMFSKSILILIALASPETAQSPGSSTTAWCGDNHLDCRSHAIPLSGTLACIPISMRGCRYPCRRSSLRDVPEYRDINTSTRMTVYRATGRLHRRRTIPSHSCGRSLPFFQLPPLFCCPSLIDLCRHAASPSSHGQCWLLPTPSPGIGCSVTIIGHSHAVSIPDMEPASILCSETSAVKKF